MAGRGIDTTRPGDDHVGHLTDLPGGCAAFVVAVAIPTGPEGDQRRARAGSVLRASIRHDDTVLERGGRFLVLCAGVRDDTVLELQRARMAAAVARELAGSGDAAVTVGAATAGPGTGPAAVLTAADDDRLRRISAVD
jgi:hypothetical protein